MTKLQIPKLGKQAVWSFLPSLGGDIKCAHPGIYVPTNFYHVENLWEIQVLHRKEILI